MRTAFLAVGVIAALAVAAPAEAGRVLDRTRVGPMHAIAVFKRAHHREFSVVTATVGNQWSDDVDLPAQLRFWRVRPSGRRINRRPHDITPPGTRSRSSAAVAYDSDRDRYLEVVSTRDGLIGQRLSATGRRVGAPFGVGGRGAGTVKLLYIPSKRRYLVAWSEHDDQVRFRTLGPTGRPSSSARMPLRRGKPWFLRLAYDPREPGVMATYSTREPFEGPAVARRLHTDGRGAGRVHRIAWGSEMGAVGYSPGADAFVAVQGDTLNAALLDRSGRRRGKLHPIPPPKAGGEFPSSVVGSRRDVLATWFVEEDFGHQGADYDDYALRLDEAGRHPRGRTVHLNTPRSSGLPIAYAGQAAAAQGADRWLVAWPLRDVWGDDTTYPPTDASEWGVAVQAIR